MKNDAVRALFSGNSSVGAHSVCKDKSQPGRSLIRPGGQGVFRQKYTARRVMKRTDQRLYTYLY